MSEKLYMLKHMAWVLIQRVGLILAGLLFTVIIPRLTGPEIYGRLSLLLAIITWCVLVSDLGMSQVLSRYTAQAQAQGINTVRRLFGRIFVVRLFSGATCAAGAFFLVRGLLHPEQLYLPMLAMIWTLAWSIAEISFAFSLGLNRAARWSLGFFLRRWLWLAAIPIGYRWGELSGALAALLVCELGLLVVAFFFNRSCRPALRVPGATTPLLPLLRFGFPLFVGALLQHTFRYSGEPLLRLWLNDYAQVGFFGLAFGVYWASEAGLLQLFFIMTPYLSTLHTEHRDHEISLWLERLMRVTTAGAVLVFLGAVLLGKRLVPILFGTAYADLAHHFIPLTLAMITVIPAGAAYVFALVEERPSTVFKACAIRFLGLMLLLPVGVHYAKSYGACLAVLGATLAYAVYFFVATRSRNILSFRKWIGLLAVGFGLLPMGLWIKACTSDLAAVVLVAGLDLALIFSLRLIAGSELLAIRRLGFSAKASVA